MQENVKYLERDIHALKGLKEKFKKMNKKNFVYLQVLTYVSVFNTHFFLKICEVENTDRIYWIFLKIRNLTEQLLSIVVQRKNFNPSTTGCLKQILEIIFFFLYSSNNNTSSS